ncbi:MAG: 5' nucleotidase, NT5C type [Burkholderiales bacterium]
MVKIALDMDGVLVNFNKGASQRHGIPLTDEQYRCSLQKHWNLTQKEFWEKCEGLDFWCWLEWMPDGKEILSLCEKEVGRENIAICTSPSRDIMCPAGKMAWIRREIPWLERRMIITPMKYWVADNTTILVDDNPEKIDAFIKAGGIGCLVPRQWNDNANENTLEYIQGCIERTKRYHDTYCKVDAYDKV